MKKLVRIGYWSRDGRDWPNPLEFVDLDWDTDDRAWVVAYLRRGFVARTYFGLATCLVCGDPNGSLELSDGVFVWPEGLAHYVELHQVRLPEEFISHLWAMEDEFEHVEIDESWWKGFTGTKPEPDP